MAHSEKAELKKQLDDYLTLGQIEQAHSPYGAGCMFASKKGGSLRLCIDYRAINALTIKLRWPIPRIDDTIDK